MRTTTVSKCLMVFTALVIGFASNATAADRSGMYYGVTGGLSMQTASTTGSPVVETGSYFNAIDKVQLTPLMSKDLEANGLGLDLFWGNNWQTEDRVVGVEVDLNLSAFDEKIQVPSTVYTSLPPHTFQFTNTIESSMAIGIRPRLGYISGDTLYYGTAGISLRKFDFKFDYTDTYTSLNHTLDESVWALGYSLGAGMEKQMTGSWLLRVDVMYTMYSDVIDTRSVSTAGAQIAGIDHGMDFTELSLRAGIVMPF